MSWLGDACSHRLAWWNRERAAHNLETRICKMQVRRMDKMSRNPLNRASDTICLKQQACLVILFLRDSFQLQGCSTTGTVENRTRIGAQFPIVVICTREPFMCPVYPLETCLTLFFYMNNNNGVMLDIR